jgi:outer membrane biosynthesis protein TonB
MELLLKDFYSHLSSLPSNFVPNDDFFLLFVKSREPTVPSDAPSLTKKEKKPRKSNKKIEEVVTTEVVNVEEVPSVPISAPIVVETTEKPVKEKKPRKSNKKTEDGNLRQLDKTYH